MRVTVVNNNEDSAFVSLIIAATYQDLEPGDVFKFVNSNCKALKTYGGHVLFEYAVDGVVPVDTEPHAFKRNDDIDRNAVIRLGTLVGLEVT